MTFTDAQLRQLKSSVRRRHVKEREIDGKTLHYLEGWWVVSEANRIFGYDSWERATVSSECVWRSPVEDRFAAAYLTRVRISVRAGDQVIVREGIGAGEAVAATPGQAHERASKAAETDATKRALSTFGSRFGLTLYGERCAPAKTAHEHAGSGGAAQRVVKSVSDRWRASVRPEKTPDGVGPESDTRSDPKGAGVDKSGADLMARSAAPPVVRGPAPKPPGGGGGPFSPSTGAATANEAPAPQSISPDPRPDQAAGVVRSTALETPVEHDRRAIALLPVYLPSPADPQPRPGRIDKSVLAIPEPRRLRDKNHLKFVARQPCLVCGRTPSQAHHLRIAQPRALGRKVSDEFTVPLCALHHHDLHMKGNEAEWWWGHSVEPLPIAERFWRMSRTGLQAPEPEDGAAAT